MTEFLRVNSTDLEQISDRIPLCKFNRFGSNWWQIFILYREIFWHQIESQSVGTSNRFLNRFWWIQQNLVKKITRMCNRFSLIWCQQLYPLFIPPIYTLNFNSNYFVITWLWEHTFQDISVDTATQDQCANIHTLQNTAMLKIILTQYSHTKVLTLPVTAYQNLIISSPKHGHHHPLISSS